jgi:hypothetical protein
VDEQVLAVPEDACRRCAGVSTVYVIENGKARQQPESSCGRGRNKSSSKSRSGLKGDEMLATGEVSTSSPPASR